jgi:hypothetical protein
MQLERRGILPQTSSSSKGTTIFLLMNHPLTTALVLTNLAAGDVSAMNSFGQQFYRSEAKDDLIS